tara:strand:+ start:292 stop:1251 length:960 start_codon:yes stop_codon:yes gene_type:complete
VDLIALTNLKMKTKYLSLLIIILIFYFDDVKSKINDKIIAKIGNNIITNYDIINEVNTILALSNKVANKEDFKKLQNVAFTSLKKNLIKKSEIEKYKIEKYSKTDLNNYIKNLEIKIGLQNLSLEDHFNKYGANYKLFIKTTINNFKWNTLIYSLYGKQLDVDEDFIKREVKAKILQGNKIVEFNLSEIVIENSENSKLSEIEGGINEIGFERTAALYSNSVTSSNDGLIGWIELKSISPSYVKQIEKLKKGEITQPIRNNDNIVIIRLNDKRITDQKDINVQLVEQNVINKKKQEKLNIFSNSHFIDLEKKTYIEING